MRLIDVDELKKQIAGMTIKNHYSAKRANALCKLLDEQPTAFDIDEVVDELKRLPKCSTWNHNSDNIDRTKAIEIVKKRSGYEDI